jgi:glycosyltransferase involved in cell wall biosynthesis
MRVLYVNHTSQVSGAERSLLELIALARSDAEVVLACPPGELMERAQARGIATTELSLPGLGFSSNLLAATYRIARAGWRVRMLARRDAVDVVHAASPRAGLLAACCIFSRPRRVVDVRDALPAGAKAAAVRWALRLTADLIVFNSRFTRSRFGPASPADAAVLYPPVDVQRLLDLPLPSEEKRGTAPMLGVLGQISPWKGQDDAIRILASVRTRVPEARLRIVGSVVFSGGSVAFDNEAFRRRLPLLAAELGVADAVELAGQSDDLEAVLGPLDVLLVPSWEEPFGRVVVEGMAAGVPVVATRAGGPSEIVEDGVSGFLASPRDPAAWVEPVVRLLESVELSRQVAESARERLAFVLGDEADRSARLRALYGEDPTRRPRSTPAAERIRR